HRFDEECVVRSGFEYGQGAVGPSKDNTGVMRMSGACQIERDFPEEQTIRAHYDIARLSHVGHRGSAENMVEAIGRLPKIRSAVPGTLARAQEAARENGPGEDVHVARDEVSG